MNALCAVLSNSGRFYQNAERIVNAADYFLLFHNGRIPNAIGVEELSALYGVGYKTANLVISYAFQRIDGIPSDIHVLRWAYGLKWIPSPKMDGRRCSKIIESWMPRDMWHLVNPVFGSLGQMLRNKLLNQSLQSIVRYTNDGEVCYPIAKRIVQKMHMQYLGK